MTIRVINESSGKPISRKKVTVFFDGILRGSIEGYTNSSGDADLDADPGKGSVHVDGKKVHSGDIRGRVTVYI